MLYMLYTFIYFTLHTNNSECMFANFRKHIIAGNTLANSSNKPLLLLLQYLPVALLIATL